MSRFGPKHRKIPVPKRHGVRDPLKRLAEKEAAIKDKINNPPKECDVQEVSQRFKRFVQLKEQANRPQPRGERHDRAQPKLKIGTTVVQKLPKETEESFLGRASQIQRDRKEEADFGLKFGVEVERNETTGAIKVRKRKGVEVDDMLKKRMKLRDGKPGKRAAKAKKMTFTEKKAQKQQKEQERKHQEEELLLKEYQYDYVPFGEVVQGPPTLKTLPRRANRQEGASRPASKRLLLHSLVDPQPAEDEQPKAKKRKGKKAPPPKVDLKGKRKKLPVATRMKIESEQQNVIEMYRKLKKKVNQ
uniref:Coiled-coil domain-containing protein 137 n=1 Tax=Anopheles atroparvus TaxID=41427 RepID=A0AAG5CP73_ANOAO